VVKGPAFLEREDLTTATEHLRNYLASFSEFEKTAAGHDLPWLRSLRQKAFARFCQAGFPTTRDEDWRFTNVSEIARAPFQLPSGDSQGLSASDIAPWRISGAACQLVFVNGRFSPRLSSVSRLPAGVEVDSLARKLALNPSALEPHLGRYLDISRDSFCALNTAFLEDGAYVNVARGVVLEAPIHLLFVSVDDGTAAMTHPRNLIIAADNSQAAVVEDYVSVSSSGPAAALSNTATELVAGDNAVIAHYMLEREHERTFNISTLRIQQGRGANVATHSVLMGGALVRNNVHPVLAGEGGDCLINGLFIGGTTQHLDNYMLVEHVSPHCGSRQFYNGILDDRAHGVFHGRIVVHRDAQKTDAKQTNRNLLLSDSARIDTKPQLEIHADDVKCTHGATIGQIDEDALFYLRSRGLDQAAARSLLLLAFAGECVARMKEEPVRRHIERLMNERLFELAAPLPHQPGERTLSESSGRTLEEIA
jgi:Fe-S cluster assembly protein SufD